MLRRRLRVTHPVKNNRNPQQEQRRENLNLDNGASFFQALSREKRGARVIEDRKNGLLKSVLFDFYVDDDFHLHLLNPFFLLLVLVAEALYFSSERAPPPSQDLHL